MRFGLPDDVLPRVLAVLVSNRKVGQVTLYGSRAKGNQRAGSDIDLCLEADALAPEELVVLESRIDDLSLPWKIDITVRQQIDNPDLLDHIERVRVKLLPEA